MRTSVRRTLCATAIAGGFTVLGLTFAASSASAADTPDTTSGVGGLVSGNQTGGAVHLPVDLTANQVTVIGHDNSSKAAPSGGSADSGDRQAAAPRTSGAGGAVSGNQTKAHVTAPVTASGNQVTAIGRDNRSSGQDRAATADTSDRGSDAGTTSGRSGTASGNQTHVRGIVPVDASDNQVTVIGSRNQAAAGSSGARPTGARSAGTTSGDNGAVAGNQTGVDALVPVDVTGNQVTVIGNGNTAETTTPTATGTTGSSTGGTTTGQNGIGSGNQTTPVVGAPITPAGNQVTVIGNGNTAETTTPTATGTTGGTTTGENGTGSGNQTTPVVDAPITPAGNQVTVLGSGNSNQRVTASDPGDPAAPTDPGTPTGPGTPAQPGTFDPDDEPVPGLGTDDGLGTGPGAAGGTSGGSAQGGPAASLAGSYPQVLPQTGAAAHAQLVGALGLILFLLGGVLLVGRREGLTGRRRGRRAAPAL